MPLFACYSRVDIPRDLVNYKRKDLERKYVRIVTDYSSESSRSSSQILLNECSISNTKSLISLGSYGLINPQLTVLNKTNILQMLLVASRVREYNSFLVYKSGILKTLYKYALVLKTGRRFCFNKNVPQTEVVRFSEYVVHVIEDLSNYNSYASLIDDGPPSGVRKLCEEAKSVKNKLVKKGVQFTMESWETPYHRNVSMNTMGGSQDMVVVKTFPEKLRELQGDVNAVEAQMIELSLFETDGQAEESLISDLISSLSLYEYRAQNLIQESVDAEQMEHYDETVNLLDYIKHLINLLKTKICISLDPNYIETNLSEAQEFEQFVAISSAEEPQESNLEESNIEMNLENQEDEADQSDASTEFLDSASDAEAEQNLDKELEQVAKESEGRPEKSEVVDQKSQELKYQESSDRLEQSEQLEHFESKESLKSLEYLEHKSSEQLSPLSLEQDSGEKLDLLDTYKLLNYQDSSDNTQTNLNRSLLSTVDELVTLRSSTDSFRVEQVVSDERVEREMDDRRETVRDVKQLQYEVEVVDDDEEEESYEDEDETEETESEEYDSEEEELSEEEESEEVSEESDSDVDVDDDEEEYDSEESGYDEEGESSEEDEESDEDEVEHDKERDTEKVVDLVRTTESRVKELVKKFEEVGVEKVDVESQRDSDRERTERKDKKVEPVKTRVETERDDRREKEKKELDLFDSSRKESTESTRSEYLKSSTDSFRVEQVLDDAKKSLSKEELEEEKLFWSTGKKDSVEKLTLFSEMSKSRSVSMESKEKTRTVQVKEKELKEKTKETKEPEMKEKVEKVTTKKDTKVDKSTEKQKDKVETTKAKEVEKELKEKTQVEKERKTEKWIEQKEKEKQMKEKEEKVVLEVEKKEKLVEQKEETERDDRKEYEDDERVERREDVKKELVPSVRRKDESVSSLYNEMSYVMDTLNRINNYLESKPPKFVANSKNFQNLLSSSSSLSLSLEDKKFFDQKTVDKDTQTSAQGSLDLEKVRKTELILRLSKEELQEKIGKEIEQELGEQFLEKERQLKEQLFGNIDDNLFKRLSNIYLPKKNLPMASAVLPYDNSFLTSSIASSNQQQYNVTNNYYTTTTSIQIPTNYHSSATQRSTSHFNTTTSNPSHNYYHTNNDPTDYHTTTSTYYNNYYSYDDSISIHMNETERSDEKGIHREANKNFVVFKKGIPSDNLRNRMLTNYERLERDRDYEDAERERREKERLEDDLDKENDRERTEVKDRSRDDRKEKERKERGEGDHYYRHHARDYYDRDQEFNTHSNVVLEPNNELKQLKKLTKLLSLDNSSNENNDDRETKEPEMREVKKVETEKEMRETERTSLKSREELDGELDKKPRRDRELDEEKGHEKDRDTEKVDEHGYPVIDLNELENLDLSDSEMGRTKRPEFDGDLESLERSEHDLERNRDRTNREDRKDTSITDTHRDTERTEKPERRKDATRDDDTQYSDTEREHEERNRDKGWRSVYRKGRLDRGTRRRDKKETESDDRREYEDDERVERREREMDDRERVERKNREIRYREYEDRNGDRETSRTERRERDHYYRHHARDYYDSEYEEDREETPRDSDREKDYHYRHHARDYYDSEYEDMLRETRERERERRERQYTERDRDYYESKYRRASDREGYPRNESYYVVEPNSSNEAMRREHRSTRYDYDPKMESSRHTRFVDRRVVELHESGSSDLGRSLELDFDRLGRNGERTQRDYTNRDRYESRERDDRKEKEKKMGKYVKIAQGEKLYKNYLIQEGQSDPSEQGYSNKANRSENNPEYTPRTTFRTTFRTESMGSSRTGEHQSHPSQTKVNTTTQSEENYGGYGKKERFENRDNRDTGRRDTESQYTGREQRRDTSRTDTHRDSGRDTERTERHTERTDRESNLTYDDMMVTNSNVVKNVIKTGGDVIYEDKMLTIRFTLSPVYHPCNSTYMQSDHNYTMSTENVLTFENNSLFSYSLSFDYSNFENFPLEVQFLNKNFKGVELVPGQKMSHRFSAHCFGPFVGLPKLNLTAHIDVQTDRVFHVYLPLAISCFFTPSMDMFRLSKSYFSSDKFKHIMRNKVYFNAPKRMSLGQVMAIVTGFGKFKLLQQAESCYYLASSFSAPFYFGTKELYRFTIFAMVEVSASHYHVHVSSDSYRLANSTSMLLKYILQN